MVLLIDNYDSFVYNLARYVLNLGFHVCVKRNDKITLDDIIRLNPSHIILSPGPCTPKEAGICVKVVQKLGKSFPILGICLGHQAIGYAYGGKICTARKPAHGKKTLITHQCTTLFYGTPNPMEVGRYHSLVVEKKSIPSDLNIDALCPDGDVMALSHKKYPIWGVQFHPESILTVNGSTILNNFLKKNKK